MRTELVKMNAAKARAFLEKNVENRNVRHRHVSDLAEQMRRGDWRVTHQGIAIGKDGRLLDGQHRLLALIEADLEIKMNVSYDVEDTAFQVIDRGARRTVADILRIGKPEAQVIRLAAKIYFGSDIAGNLQKMQAALLPYLDDLPSHHSRYFGTAKMRLAAVACIINTGDKDYVVNTHANLCGGNVDELPPVAKALLKSFIKGGLNSTDQADALARGVVVFDPANSHLGRVAVKDPATGLEFIRVALRRALISAGELA